MTDQTRRNVLRYGIAIDLVIMATGVGMLVPATATLLVVTYAVAVSLSVWRGGWKGGLTALILSLVALVGVYPDVVRSSHVAAFLGLSVAGGALVAYLARPRTGQAVIADVGETVAMPYEPQIEREAVREPEAEDFASKPLERSALAEVVPLIAPEQEDDSSTTSAPSKKRGRKKKGTAAQAESARLAREMEERLEAERRAAREERSTIEAARHAVEEEAVRVKQQLEARLETERRAAEEEVARQRAEAERLALEAKRAEEERARVEAERIAAEEEAARLALEAKRAEEERARLEAERQAAAEEAARVARELEERLTAERRAAEEEAAARVARELEERLAEERRAALAEAERIAAEAKRAEEEAARVAERLAEERRAALEETARQRAETERLAAEAKRAEEERVRLEAERRTAEEERERLTRELETAQRSMQEQVDAARKTAEEEMRRQLESEREVMRAHAEQELAAERERLAAASALNDSATRRPVAGTRPMPKSTSLVDTVKGWFKRETNSHAVNLKTKRVATNGNSTATKRPASAASSAPPRRTSSTSTSTSTHSTGKPRILMIERRRGTADTAVPRLRQRGVDVQVVERWVDAVDEMFRLRPNALFLDIEHSDFERIQRTVAEKNPKLPIVLTGRGPSSAPPSVRYAAFVVRPYDVDDIVRVAQQAYSTPENLLAEQLMPRQQTPSKPTPIPVAQVTHRPTPVPSPVHSSSTAAQPQVESTPPSVREALAAAVAPKPALRPVSNEEYEVVCFSCRSGFDAVDADWCSCLAKERTLVCTNCLACFCKAPPAYKEKFWVEAPPRLFERKTAEARRQQAALPVNPPKEQVIRPLVLTVEDDEDIQAIVQRVCQNLGYGFIWAGNGQDGLELARDYKPNLILSDAFMPKLDGREMCRMLKEDAETAECKMIVMTGLYTDTKYRSEAVKRFHVDDYVAKPVSITDLINLLQKHLEGVTGLPIQEDLHELHRQDVDADEAEHGETDDMPLADVLKMPPMQTPKPVLRVQKGDTYDVSCFNCQMSFEATHAEWCSCVGRDNTLVCEHCGGCFCKAPAAYRERFWIDAPPSLFERKMIGSKRNLGARSNPHPEEVKRPLILLVEDDENVQLIVRTVVSSMGYGFVVGANGQEGLSLAREYNPDLILSDAFMPKLDGREMCRLLKEDPATSRSKAIIMTGLYTDRKYRNEALDYFKVDDYVAKPLAVDDLIKLFKKHLPQEAAAAQ